MGTKTYNNYEDLLTFTRASGGHALRPVSYGDEIFGNTGFDDASEWTLALDSISISSGKLIYDATNNIRGADQQVSVQAGKIYQLSFEVLSGTARLYLSEGYASTSLISDLAAANYGVGKHVVNVVANGSYDEIGFSLSKFNGGTACEIDDFSVKEVTFDESDGTLTLFEHPTNIPRVEYDADGNRLGLLVEEQRTNLVTDSEVAILSYNPASLTVTPNSVVAPDGTTSADLLTSPTQSNVVFNWAGGSFRWNNTNGATFTASLFIKFIESSEDAFTVYFGSAASQEGLPCVFQRNITTGEITTSSSGASVEKYPNGWYRLIATYTSTGSSAIHTFVLNVDKTTTLSVWGAMSEQGASFPTSYIKTTGSTATRSGEICDVPVSDFGYNASNEGTFVIQVKNIKYDPNGTDYPFLLRFDNATNSHDRLGIFLAESSGNMNAEVRRNNVGQVSSNFFTATGGTVDSIKIAFAFAENDFAVSDDGDTVVTDTSGTLVPSQPISKVGLGQAFNSVHINGCITSFQYYPRRLTNAQLEDLSS
jgi:hypothetical protein